MEQHTRIFKKCRFFEFFQKTLKVIFISSSFFLICKIDFYLILILIYLVVGFLEL